MKSNKSILSYAVCAIVFLLIFSGCDLTERGFSHYLPITVHKVGVEYYQIGSRELPTDAASLMPQLSDYPEAVEVEYQYDYKRDLIDNPECSYLTFHFEEQDYYRYKQKVEQDQSIDNVDSKMEYYLPARDDALNTVDFVQGTFLFPAKYMAEQKIEDRYYLRLIGFSDETNVIVFIYLSVGNSATFMGVDGLLSLDFFQNYPWNSGQE